MDKKYIPPSILEARVRTAASYIPTREYSVELFRAVCEEKLAQHVDSLRVEEVDLKSNDTAAPDLDNDATLVEPAITNFKIMENTGGSGLLHAYGDMVGIIGSHFRRQEQRGYAAESASARAEYAMDAMEAAAEDIGLAKPRSMKLRVLRFQRMLAKSAWPKLLCTEKDVNPNYAEEIHNRATLYCSQYKERPSEAMLHLVAERFEHVLSKQDARELLEFTRLYTKGHLNHTTAVMEVRRLMPVATPKVLATQKPDLNSTEGLELLFKYVKRTEVIWKSNKFKGVTTLTDAVTLLLEEAEMNELVLIEADKSTTVSGGSNAGTVTKSSGVTVEYRHLLNAEINSSGYTWVDDRLAAHREGAPLPDGGDATVAKKDKELQAVENLPWWYHPIKDIVESKSGIMKRALMGAIKLPARGAALYVAELKKEYSDFINLRLVWDEKSKLTDRILAFRATGETVRQLAKGKITNLDVMNDVQEEYRVQVKDAFSKRQHDLQSTLLDSNKREQYKTLMDRALMCKGYPSSEDPMATDTAHGAVVDLFEAFIEVGDPMGGDMLELHTNMAMEFVHMAMTEAQKQFDEYLNSENPAAKHPKHFLNRKGVAYLRLSRGNKDAKEMVSKHEYWSLMGRANSTTTVQDGAASKDRAAKRVQFADQGDLRSLMCGTQPQLLSNLIAWGR